jgi:hypothetical protein
MRLLSAESWASRCWTTRRRRKKKNAYIPGATDAPARIAAYLFDTHTLRKPRAFRKELF